MDTLSGALTYGFVATDQNDGTINSYLIVGTYDSKKQTITLHWEAGSPINPIRISGGNLAFVPEPSTFALMASVGMALYFLRRRAMRGSKSRSS
ncbi:MAG: PEP-CTERM sorting domain-containing protein [Arcobacter sp.]|nr:PEP-CTERM sorting domain-containing protein [Arcobacter sp.]